MNAQVEKFFRSEKPPLVVAENDSCNARSNANPISSKGLAFDRALQLSGILRNASVTADECTVCTLSTPNVLKRKWAGYPGNNPNKLSLKCLFKLKELYDIGKINKKRKVGAERAHQILLDTVIVDHWDEKLVVTVPKIKAFFQLSPKKMQDTISTQEIETNQIHEAAMELVDNERDMNAIDMLDLS